MGCAGVDKFLNCRDLENNFNHPYFWLAACNMERCSDDKCNHGGVQMLSGTRRFTLSLTTLTLALLRAV